MTHLSTISRVIIGEINRKVLVLDIQSPSCLSKGLSFGNLAKQGREEPRCLPDKGEVLELFSSLIQDKKKCYIKVRVEKYPTQRFWVNPQCCVTSVWFLSLWVTPKGHSLPNDQLHSILSSPLKKPSGRIPECFKGSEAKTSNQTGWEPRYPCYSSGGH